MSTLCAGLDYPLRQKGLARIATSPDQLYIQAEVKVRQARDAMRVFLREELIAGPPRRDYMGQRENLVCHFSDSP